ncbi:MAG: O-antigen ligase family protein [Pleurocapsa minor GSE-CHR-MK-17-07R]|jgi:O-antigen ligase/tetratricopeptide (TPR) repeat protein|nr:O-antigen ligase family protein [Pleurocapsa minor GSE-CHR-MK 17-07R]
MRYERIGLIFLAVFTAFFGGSPFYYTLLPVRVIMHVVMTIVLAAWLVRRIRARRGLPLVPLTWPLAAAGGVWLLSTLFAADPRMAAESIWLPFVQVLAFLFCAAQIQGGRQRLLWEMQFMLAALAVILAGLQFGSYLFGWGITPETRIGWLSTLTSGVTPFVFISPMLYLPLGVSTWLAAYTAPLVLVAFAWSLTARRRDERLAMRVLAVCLLAALVLTFSRGGFLALAGGAGVFVALRLVPMLQRRVTAAWMKAIVAGLPLVAIGAGVLVVVLLISRDPSRSSGDQLRVGLWQNAISAFQADPLTGYGVGGFGRAARDFRDISIPSDDRLGTAHNVLLNAAAETGIAAVIVVLALAGIVAWRWWRLRAQADAGYRLRLDACFAALCGFALQSMVDYFTATPILLLVGLLAAYCVVPAKRAVAETPKTARAAVPLAAVALVVTLAYGVFWVFSDSAQASYASSVRTGDLTAAQAAAARDPAVRVYHLQTAYLLGREAQSEDEIAAAIAAYEAGLALEPTWDSGWVNLAALYERSGGHQTAFAALERAAEYSNTNGSAYNRARLAETYGVGGLNEPEIVGLYLREMDVRVPLSPLWLETPLRRRALEAYLAAASLETRYDVTAALLPDRLDDLPAPLGERTGEAYVAGRVLLAQGDAEGAQAAFSDALSLSPGSWQYALWAARANLAATGDTLLTPAGDDFLRHAELISQRLDGANAVRALQTSLTREARLRLQLTSLPPVVVDQNFEGVLFNGRVGNFQVYPEMRRPSVGEEAVAPALDAAELVAASGETDFALNIVRAVLEISPESPHALALAAQLQSESGS